MADKKNPDKENPMSWNEIVEKVTTELGQLAEIKEQAKQFTTELKKTHKEMDEALKAGRTAEFTEFAKATTAHQAAIISAENRIASVLTFTADNIVDAWNSHIEESNRAFSEKLQDYQRAVNALCGMYLELVEMQRKALKDRSTAADILCKISPNHPATRYETAALLSGRLENAYRQWRLNPPLTVPAEAKGERLICAGIITPPDLAFFIANGSIERSKLQPLLAITKAHQPTKQSIF